MIEFFNYLNAMRPLTGDATAGLMKVVRAKELRRGQVWLQEGAVCEKLTFVVKGLMKLYFETGSKEVVLSFAKENEFMVSSQSFYDQRPSRYNIRSVTPSVILYLSFNELSGLIDKFPELNFHFKKITQQKISEHEYHAGLLMLPPRERYKMLVFEKGWMTDGKILTDRLLAAYLGIGANVLSSYKVDI